MSLVKTGVKFLKLKFLKKLSEFSQKIKVTEDHLDELNHVNNVQYLYWAQEIAKSHWSYLTKKVSSPPGVWVVRHHDILYKLGAYLGDEIIISTYVKSVKGPISERVVEFYNSKNNKKVIVRVISKWCYLNDAKNRKIIAVPNLISEILDPVDLKIK